MNLKKTISLVVKVETNLHSFTEHFFITFTKVALKNLQNFDVIKIVLFFIFYIQIF